MWWIIQTHLNGFTQKRRLMHELLRDTTDVDTCTAQAPLCSLGWGLHKIEYGNLGAELSCLFGASQTTGSASDDDEVVVVRFSIYEGSADTINGIVVMFQCFHRELRRTTWISLSRQIIDNPLLLFIIPRFHSSSLLDFYKLVMDLFMLVRCHGLLERDSKYVAVL